MWEVWTAFWVAVVLGADHIDAHRLHTPAKALASAGFVARAVEEGGLESLGGRVIIAALGLSLLADVCLTGRGRRWFVAGLALFLTAHIVYGVAFTLRGGDPRNVGIWLAALFAVGTVVWRWLRPHVPRRLQVPVLAYIAAISYMVATAVETVRAVGGPLIVVGAVLFFVSDLFVARQRFVEAAFVNRLVGLPLYYGAQLLIARHAVL